MIETKKIIEAAERHLEGSDMFVVECTSTPGNEIELTIDSDTSVGIDACAELSVKILAKLEEVTDEGITLSYEEKQAVEGKKKKQLVKVTRSYPFDQIKYTKEWLDFK